MRPSVRILPLQALTAQMSGRFRAELLGSHTKVAMRELGKRLELLRRGSHGRGVHWSTVQLNLSRFGHTSPRLPV
jgi:hypothetical protein